MADQDESEYEDMRNMVNNIIDAVNEVEERVTALEKKVSGPSHPPSDETPLQKRIREREERLARLGTPFRNKDGSRPFTAMSSGLGGIKGRLSRRKSRRKMPVSLRRRNMSLSRRKSYSKMSRSRRKSYSKMSRSLRRRKMSRSRRKTYKMF